MNKINPYVWANNSHLGSSNFVRITIIDPSVDYKKATKYRLDSHKIPIILVFLGFTASIIFFGRDGELGAAFFMLSLALLLAGSLYMVAKSIISEKILRKSYKLVVPLETETIIETVDRIHKAESYYSRGLLTQEDMMEFNTVLWRITEHSSLLSPVVGSLEKLDEILNRAGLTPEERNRKTLKQIVGKRKEDDPDFDNQSGYSKIDDFVTEHHKSTHPLSKSKQALPKLDQ